MEARSQGAIPCFLHFNNCVRNFPGGPVAKTPCSQGGSCLGTHVKIKDFKIKKKKNPSAAAHHTLNKIQSLCHGLEDPTWSGSTYLSDCREYFSSSELHPWWPTCCCLTCQASCTAVLCACGPLYLECTTYRYSQGLFPHLAVLCLCAASMDHLLK